MKASFALLLIGTSAMALTPAAADVLSPATAFRLRDYGSDGNTAPEYISESYIFILDAPFDQEDEAFVEYALAGQPEALEVILSLTVSHLEPANPAFKVAAYADGTGIPSLARWRGGTYLASLPTLTRSQHSLSLDVTQAYNNAVQAGDAYLGFRLYDTTFDTQVFYHGSSLAVTIPEPASMIVLAGASSVSLLLRRRHRR